MTITDILRPKPAKLLDNISKNKGKNIYNVGEGAFRTYNSTFGCVKAFKEMGLIELEQIKNSKYPTLTKRGLEVQKSFDKIREVLNDKSF